MTGRLIDETGQKYGTWYVAMRAGANRNNGAVWRCECAECGHKRSIIGTALRKNPPICPECRRIERTEPEGGRYEFKKSLFANNPLQILQRVTSPDEFAEVLSALILSPNIVSIARQAQKKWASDRDFVEKIERILMRQKFV